jgi:hypothetical protein
VSAIEQSICTVRGRELAGLNAEQAALAGPTIEVIEPSVEGLPGRTPVHLFTVVPTIKKCTK